MPMPLQYLLLRARNQRFVSSSHWASSYSPMYSRLQLLVSSRAALAVWMIQALHSICTAAGGS